MRRSWREWRRKEGKEGGGRGREGGVGGGGGGRKGGGERQGGGVETEPPGQIPVELLLYFFIFLIFLNFLKYSIPAPLLLPFIFIWLPFKLEGKERYPPGTHPPSFRHSLPSFERQGGEVETEAPGQIPVELLLHFLHFS